MELSLENILKPNIDRNSFKNCIEINTIKMNNLLNFYKLNPYYSIIKYKEKYPEINECINNINNKISKSYIKICNTYNLKIQNYYIYFTDINTCFLPYINTILLNYKNILDYIKNKYKNLIIIDICHELGHLIANHEFKRLIFNKNNKNNNLITKFLYNIEYEADIITIEFIKLLDLDIKLFINRIELTKEHCKCNGYICHSNHHPKCADRIKNIENYYNNKYKNKVSN